MEYRTLGRPGQEDSQVGFGCGNVGGLTSGEIHDVRAGATKSVEKTSDGWPWNGWTLLSFITGRRPKIHIDHKRMPRVIKSKMARWVLPT
jgi:hypothetical protein